MGKQGLFGVGILSLGLAGTTHAQIILTGTAYSQSFDTLGSGLPAGWTVRTGASATSLGTALGFSPGVVSWATSTGNFNNYASADGLSASASSGTQSASTDRALGVRQTAGFGDPGAAFVLQIDQTTGFKDFSLGFKFQTLNEQGRTTIWTVDYALGAAPASFTALGTITQDTWGSVTKNFALPSVLEDQSEDVWLRIAALNQATGSNSRDSFGLDDFSLQFSAIPEPAAGAWATAIASVAALACRRCRRAR